MAHIPPPAAPSISRARVGDAMRGKAISMIASRRLCHGAFSALVFGSSSVGLAVASERPLRNASYLGVWAGERMPCAAPNQRLHVYCRTSVSHPVIFQDMPGYACRVLETRGRSPDWTLRLSCTLTGPGQKTKWVPAVQKLHLSEDGNRLQMEFIQGENDVLWAEEFLFCRPFRNRPITRRQTQPQPQE